MTPPSNIRIHLEQRTAVISFTDACLSDNEALDAASRDLQATLGAGDPVRVIFDFEGVRFFSSRVLGLLLETRAWLAAGQGRIAVSSLDPSLRRVFRVTNLEKLFDFYPDRRAALAAAPSR